MKKNSDTDNQNGSVSVSYIIMKNVIAAALKDECGALHNNGKIGIPL